MTGPAQIFVMVDAVYRQDGPGSHRAEAPLLDLGASGETRADASRNLLARLRGEIEDRFRRGQHAAWLEGAGFYRSREDPFQDEWMPRVSSGDERLYVTARLDAGDRAGEDPSSTGGCGGGA